MGRRFTRSPLEIARGKIRITPHVALAEDLSAAEVPNADPLGGERVPNYIRALAQHTKAAPQFAHLVRTVLYGGSLSPGTKMAIVLRVAQVYGSAYTAAHAQRWLRASERGQGLLAALKGGAEESLPSAYSLALRYKAEFGERGAVEVALQTCAFAFMNRFTDGLRLPSEDEAIRAYQEIYGAGAVARDWNW
jgi:alkylhydroperoxidase family enzyme